MSDNRTTELREKLTERGIEWTAYEKELRLTLKDFYDTRWNANGVRWSYLEINGKATLSPVGKVEIELTPEQAIAATLGWIDEPDTIRNELTDGGLIADVLAPVCVDEKERRAFERGRVHERFAQQIFKEATS